MDADAAAELAALRRRAYGEGADIADDPAAQRRLAELERQEHGAAPMDDAPDEAPPDASADLVPPGDDAASTASPRDEEPATASPARWSFAAVGIGATAVFAVGIGAGMLLDATDLPGPADATPTPSSTFVGSLPESGVSAFDADWAHTTRSVPVEDAVYLGTSYSWDVWTYTAATPGVIDELRHTCLILERSPYASHSACGSHTSDLSLRLPIDKVPRDMRPAGAAWLDFRWSATVHRVTVYALSTP